MQCKLVGVHSRSTQLRNHRGAMDVIELSDDEPSPQPKRRQKPPPKVERVVLDEEDGQASVETGAALRTLAGTRDGVGKADGAESGVRITIDLCEDEDEGGSSVIDLTGDDDASLARKLQRQLNAGTSSTVDLASLHLARQARRTKVKADPDAPTVSVEEDDLLYEERRKLKTFLQSSAQGVRVSGTWHNPASQPGGLLYERFVAAWAQVPCKLMRMVFHGTADANVKAICRDGLDPNRRAGQAHGPGEYFGEQASTSLSYCKGGRKMLIFLVLLDPSGVTATGAGVTVIHRPEFQLPIAVVTFEPPSAHDLFAGVNPFAAAANLFSGLGRALGGAGPSAPAAAPPVLWPVIANNHPAFAMNQQQRAAAKRKQVSTSGKRPGESHHDYLMRQ